MSEKIAWDADCDASGAALERFMRALLLVRGHFTDSHALAPIDKPTRAVTVFFRVWIPRGSEERFCSLAKIGKLKAPPKAHV